LTRMEDATMRDSLPKLEAIAVKGGEVNSGRVGDIMEGWVKVLGLRHCHGHISMSQNLRIGERSRDPFDTVVSPLMRIDLFDIGHEHEHERMLWRACNKTIAQDRIGLILCIRLIGNHEAGIGSSSKGRTEVTDGGDNIGVDIDTTILIQELQTQNVRLTLWGALGLEERTVDHGHVADAVVIPKGVAPFVLGGGVGKGGHEVDTPRVEPDAGRLARADPYLVDMVRDAGREGGGGAVLATGFLPDVSVCYGAFTVIPDVVAVYV